MGSKQLLSLGTLLVSLTRHTFDYAIEMKRTSVDFQEVLMDTAEMLAEPIRLLSD